MQQTWFRGQHYTCVLLFALDVFQDPPSLCSPSCAILWRFLTLTVESLPAWCCSVTFANPRGKSHPHYTPTYGPCYSDMANLLPSFVHCLNSEDMGVVATVLEGITELILLCNGKRCIGVALFICSPQLPMLLSCCLGCSTLPSTHPSCHAPQSCWRHYNLVHYTPSNNCTHFVQCHSFFFQIQETTKNDAV